MMQRNVVSLRVAPAAEKFAEEVAGRLNVKRSTVFRAMLNVAATHADEVERRIQLELDS